MASPFSHVARDMLSSRQWEMKVRVSAMSGIDAGLFGGVPFSEMTREAVAFVREAMAEAVLAANPGFDGTWFSHPENGMSPEDAKRLSLSFSGFENWLAFCEAGREGMDMGVRRFFLESATGPWPEMAAGEGPGSFAADDGGLLRDVFAKGVPPLWRDAIGCEVLTRAVTAKSLSGVEAALGFGCDPFLATSQVHSPIVMAASGWSAGLAVMLGRGRAPGWMLSNALSASCGAKNPVSTRLLLDAEGGREAGGMSVMALAAAARMDDVESATMLLEAGADGTEKNPAGDFSMPSPLVSAARNGSWKMARVLLDAGADPNEEIVAEGGLGTGVTVLEEALRATAKGVGVARLLLERGASHGDRELAMALLYGGPEAVGLMLEFGCKVNGDMRLGEGRALGSPLAVAAREGDCESVSLLLGAGADPHAVDGSGRSAMEEASMVGGGVLAMFEEWEMGRGLNGAKRSRAVSP